MFARLGDDVSAAGRSGLDSITPSSVSISIDQYDVPMLSTSDSMSIIEDSASQAVIDDVSENIGSGMLDGGDPSCPAEEAAIDIDGMLVDGVGPAIPNDCDASVGVYRERSSGGMSPVWGDSASPSIAGRAPSAWSALVVPSERRRFLDGRMETSTSDKLSSEVLSEAVSLRIVDPATLGDEETPCAARRDKRPEESPTGWQNEGVRLSRIFLAGGGEGS